MQISEQQAVRALRSRSPEAREVSPGPVASVEELAVRHGVRQEELRRFTDEAWMAEDPARERRVRELARRVAAGTYSVSPEQVVEMAERRALADRAGEL